MELTKRLVILTGKTGRGTAVIERNGMGVYLTLNVFSLPDLTAGEYVLGVKTRTSVFKRALGSLGKIKTKFSLPENDYDAVHLVLFRSQDETPELYGTTEERRMWEGNFMDGLRGQSHDKTTDTADGEKQSAPPQTFAYSERKIDDYFLRIDPSVYRDNAVAEENYFRFAAADGERLRDIVPPASPRARADEPSKEADAGGTDELPSQTERKYLRDRYRFDATDTPDKNDVTSLRADDAAATTEPNGRYIPSQNGDGIRPAPQLAAEETAAAIERATQERDVRVRPASQYTVEEAVSAVKTGAAFYDRIKDKLAALFAHAETFAPLAAALPGTRWVKVDYDGAGRYYTVGLIGDPPAYIAYGVPGSFSSAAPLEGADFVPVSPDKPTEGFWVLFQSAATGEEVKK